MPDIYAAFFAIRHAACAMPFRFDCRFHFRWLAFAATLRR
jgi:hypothetical protein